MVAVLISCDPKGNHLQAASRGKISAKAINPVLKDKPEAPKQFYVQTDIAVLKPLPKKIN